VYTKTEESSNKERKESSEINSTSTSDKPLAAYTDSDIASLFAAFEIPLGSQGTLARDNSGQYTIYAHPFQVLDPLILLKESIDYFLNQNRAVSDRRVCFLLNDINRQPLAFILQCSELNKANAEKLHLLLDQKKLKKSDEIIKDASLVRLFKVLYANVHGLFLGSLANQALVKQLQDPLLAAFQPKKMALDFKGPVAPNASIVLAEHCMSMLKTGITTKVDSTKVFSWHREQCITCILKLLEKLKVENKTLYTEMMTYFEVCFKYSLLKVSEARVKFPDITNENEESLKAIESLDTQAEVSIHSLPFIEMLRDYFELLDMKTLIQMAGFVNQPSLLLEQLKKMKIELEKSLREWEKSLESQMNAQNQGIIGSALQKIKLGLGSIFSQAQDPESIVNILQDIQIREAQDFFNGSTIGSPTSSTSAPQGANLENSAVNDASNQKGLYFQAPNRGQEPKDPKLPQKPALKDALNPKLGSPG